MKIAEVVLMVTTIFTALMAGLFYAYSISVTSGLAKLSDIEYLKAMQSINRVIQNPAFFICFIGLLILMPLSCYQYYGQQLIFILLIAATICYFFGVMGVTIFGNVPLNKQLDKFDISHATLAAIQQQRLAFEKKWNMLNDIRTITSLLTVLLIIIACLLNRK